MSRFTEEEIWERRNKYLNELLEEHGEPKESVDHVAAWKALKRCLVHAVPFGTPRFGQSIRSSCPDPLPCLLLILGSLLTNLVSQDKK